MIAKQERHVYHGTRIQRLIAEMESLVLLNLGSFIASATFGVALPSNMDHEIFLHAIELVTNGLVR